ncbi:putative reverse transcriptase domain-containing protein, partial [Tanacetum coccineum]
LQGRALTWWNSQVATLGLNVVNGKSWIDMRKMMMEEFYLDEEVQRLENELRSLKKFKTRLKELPRTIKGSGKATTTKVPTTTTKTTTEITPVITSITIEDREMLGQ